MLGAVELALFKALFDRPQDWVDIAAVVANDAVDVGRVRQGLVELVGAEDSRVARWESLRT